MVEKTDLENTLALFTALGIKVDHCSPEEAKTMGLDYILEEPGKLGAVQTVHDNHSIYYFNKDGRYVGRIKDTPTEFFTARGE